VKHLKGTGFERPPEKPIERLICSIEGSQKRGKTHLALTAAAKRKGNRKGIGVLNFDEGLDGVVQKFMNEGKEVYHSIYKSKIDLPPGKRLRGQDLLDYRSEQGDQIYRSFRKDWTFALENFRTVIVDTATELWEIMRLKQFGKLDQVKPHHYTPINREYRDMISEAYDSEANVILVHKVKDEWLNDKRTGKKELQGFKETAFLTHCHLRVFRTPRDEWDPPDDLGFRVEIVECRQNAELTGEILEPPMNNLPMISTMIFEDTDPDDWE
jgi:hypothetical protein